MTKVNTVLGSISSRELGRTLMHEHLFVAYPGAEFDSSIAFDRPAFISAATRRLEPLLSHGVTTIVDPCPIEVGRNVELMAEVSERTHINFICTTGFYMEKFGLPVYWRARSAERIAELYIREIEVGIGSSGTRAGAIKCATSEQITELEEKFLVAACIAQKATGVPIITHTEAGLGGPQQQDVFERHGVSLSACLIGHCCVNPDPAYHEQIVESWVIHRFRSCGNAQVAIGRGENSKYHLAATIGQCRKGHPQPGSIYGEPRWRFGPQAWRGPS